MAISANTVWEIRTAGASTNGGGFVTGASGTDRSQQDSAHSTRTDIVIDGSDNTKITSSADAFASDDVGNIINITSGTGFTTGRYEITAEASGVATLDRAVGTVGSTGGNGTLGGAMTLIQANEDDMVAGNIAYVKADGTHTLTSAFTFAGGTNGNPLIMEGYTTTRGDNGQATISHTTSGKLTVSGSTNMYNIIYNHSVNNSDAVLFAADHAVFNCKFNRTGTGTYDAVAVSADSAFINCEFISTNGPCIDPGGDIDCVNCYFHDSTIGAECAGQPVNFVNCIFDTLSSYGIRYDAVDGGNVVNCTFYNCDIGAYYTSGSAGSSLINSIFDNCTTYGIQNNSGTLPAFISHNNFTSNGTDTLNVLSRNETTLAPSFTDAAGGDFTVGDNMKAIGLGAVGYTSYVDLGAVQTEPAGGGNANLLRGKL